MVGLGGIRWHHLVGYGKYVCLSWLASVSAAYYVLYLSSNRHYCENSEVPGYPEVQLGGFWQSWFPVLIGLVAISFMFLLGGMGLAIDGGFFWYICT